MVTQSNCSLRFLQTHVNGLLCYFCLCSDSYLRYTVLDEEIEVYLRIAKVDDETSKNVLLPDTAFQIYWLDEEGDYQKNSDGTPKLVTMIDTTTGGLEKTVDTFYTNSEGVLTLPEHLPLGKYRMPCAFTS